MSDAGGTTPAAEQATGVSLDGEVLPLPWPLAPERRNSLVEDKC